MKPLIGLTGYYVNHIETGKKAIRGLPGQDMAMVSYDYARSVERAGGIPVLLPLIKSGGIDALLDRIDGVLVTGGADINPMRYREYPHSTLGNIVDERDEFELELVNRALQRDLPIFGICRGLQVLNVARGGSLYQDLETELGPEYFHAHTQYQKWQGTHMVRVERNTKLFIALEQAGTESKDEKTMEFLVNSYHHQAIKTLGSGLIATAFAHDQVIEAIESPNHQFVVAVQWHPEMMSDRNKLQQQLFDYFVEHVRKSSRAFVG